MEENNDLNTLAQILAYHQIREHEDFQMKEAELKALCARSGL
jgi:hypothetical protein